MKQVVMKKGLCKICVGLFFCAIKFCPLESTAQDLESHTTDSGYKTCEMTEEKNSQESKFKDAVMSNTEVIEDKTTENKTIAENVIELHAIDNSPQSVPSTYQSFGSTDSTSSLSNQPSKRRKRRGDQSQQLIPSSNPSTSFETILAYYTADSKKLKELNLAQSTQIRKLTEDIGNLDQQYKNLEKLVQLNLLDGEYRTSQNIGLGNELKICLVLAVFSTFVVYVNPASLWASPFIFFYFLGSSLGTFEILKSWSGPVSKVQQFRTVGRKQ